PRPPVPPPTAPRRNPAGAVSFRGRAKNSPRIAPFRRVRGCTPAEGQFGGRCPSATPGSLRGREGRMSDPKKFEVITVPPADPWARTGALTPDPPGTRYFLKYGDFHVMTSHPQYPGWIELAKFEYYIRKSGISRDEWPFDERWIRNGMVGHAEGG